MSVGYWAMTKGIRLPAKVALSAERLWLRALPTLTRDYLSVSVDGFRLYGSKQHQFMLYWFLRGSYERYTRRLFQRALKPGMRVIDLGAHIGYFTLLAARAVGPAGKVYSFECDPSNARFLRHNVALNGYGEAVRIVTKAAANHSGVARFIIDSASSGRGSLALEREADNTIEVECTAVDDVIESQEQIGIVKIDIEGTEVDALRGMERTLSRMEDLVMFVECNPSALSAAGSSVADLLEELARHAFQVRVIHESKKSLSTDLSELFEAERSGSDNYYTNLYCTKGS